MNTEKIELCRERLYTSLEEHCHQMQPQDLSRFAKLLLRLPSLRSIGLKCPEPLFFSQLFPNLPFDSFIGRLIQQPNRDLRTIALEVENEEYHRKLRVSTPLLSPATPMSPLGGNMTAEFFAAFGGSHSTGTMNSSNTMMGSTSADTSFSYSSSFIKQEPSNPFS